MRECAFCFSTEDITKEHIISDWLNELFPGESDVKYEDGKGRSRKWTANKIDWRARVVCGTCNNGWMSEIESKMAKPTLTPLIRGDVNVPITMEVARAIAVFGFKTAVIVDHAQHPNRPWFPRELRQAFREDQSISTAIQMWICGIYGRRRAIDFHGGYFSGRLPSGGLYQSYVCTVAIGHLVFQVHSGKQTGIKKQIAPLPFHESVAVPIWPGLQDGLVWPFMPNLQGKREFDLFWASWKSVAEI